MKNIGIRIWRLYAAVGAVWLTFTIVSPVFFASRTRVTVDGQVEALYEVEWDGYREVHARVETRDGKGTVMVKLYDPGIDVGDNVGVEISTGGSGTGYIHSRLQRLSSKTGADPGSGTKNSI